MQVQIALPAELWDDFRRAAEDDSVTGIVERRHVSDPAVFGFDLQQAIELVKVSIETVAALLALAPPLARLLRKSRSPIVVTSPLGKISLDPAHDLSVDEVRHLLETLAKL